MNDFFTVQSIAVIGASTHPEKVGHQVFRNLIGGNQHLRKKRVVIPINPTAESVLGVRAYPSLTAVTLAVQMVVIATPAATVAGLVDEMIARNQRMKDRVKFVVIISAGFAEIDEKGKELQHLITTKLTLAGIRLLGPNSLGFIAPHEFLNASFAGHQLADGHLALISQSGAMLTAMFDALENQQVGISFAVSLGNKPDLNENDFLEYAARDPQTHVIALYLESFSHLPTFFELTSKLSKKKPIIVLKGGTSQHGQKASASHTAALATNQVLLTAAAQQMGFVLVDTIEELLNVSFFLAQHNQAPENVMVITNAGGPAVNTIDELERHHVSLAQWSKHLNFDELLPQSQPHNPLDLLGDAQPEHYRAAIELAQHDMNVESMLIIVTPQAVTNMDGIVTEIIKHRGRKPLFVSLIGGDHLEPLRQKLRAAKIASTPFPNDLVSILAVMHTIAMYRYQLHTFVRSEPHAPLLRFTEQTPQLPSLRDVFQLLEKNGFQLPKYHLVTDPRGLRGLTYPLFAKTANLSLLHKKKLGAVYGMVHSTLEAARAYKQLSAFGNEVLFQEVIPIENELLLGIQNDEQFGLFLTFGLGGNDTNIIGDRAYVFLPAAKQIIERAWNTTKASQLFANEPQRGKQVVTQALLLQKLVMRNSWLKSVEINPLVVNDKGILAADVKVGV